MSNKVYEIVTERIVDLLNKGIVPWQKPWNSRESFPRNLVSKKPYRGINVFMLGAMSYQSPYWLSYKQAEALGANVRKGEKGSMVVFWKWLDGQINPDTGKPERIPLLRYYTVFNSSQCDGLTVPASEERKADPIPQAVAVVDAMQKRPEIRYGMDRAYYSPGGDFVGMPNAGAFRNDASFYSVLFHELTHSTGAEHRLNRKGVSGSEGEWSAFGSTPYAKEELVAEMGAAYLCGHCGIVEHTIENSAAYIQSWKSRLSEDPKLVVHAAAQAQRAADFILGVSFDAAAE